MITLIAAVSSNGIIGNSNLNGLPWHCPEELKLFKALTLGKTVVMGRKTAEEVGSLPKRFNIVITRDPNYSLPGFTTMNIQEFLIKSSESRQLDFMICGGAEMYSAFLPYTNNIYISYMKFEVEGDIALPDMGLHAFTKNKVHSCDKFDTFLYERT